MTERIGCGCENASGRRAIGEEAMGVTSKIALLLRVQRKFVFTELAVVLVGREQVECGTTRVP